MKQIKLFEPELTVGDAWAVCRQVLSRQIGPGPKVEEFERRLAIYLGVPHVVAFNSGTSALMAAMRVLASGTQPTVVGPAYTHPAWRNAATCLGWKTEAVDIDQTSLCMSTRKAIDAFQKYRDVVVVYVRHNGCDDGGRRRICAAVCADRRLLVEDASQALGILGTPTLADITTYSFSVPKQLTTGQGGAAATHFKSVADDLRAFRNQGLGAGRMGGGNLRMTDIQAALGCSQLSRIKATMNRRRRIYGWYGRHAVDSAQLRYGWCVLYETDAPADLVERMRAAGVEVTRPYAALGDSRSVGAPNTAKRMAHRLVYLPSHTLLTEKDVVRVCKVINEREAAGREAMEPRPAPPPNR